MSKTLSAGNIVAPPTEPSVHQAQPKDSEEPESPAETLFPVPVLAEPHAESAKLGEARESTVTHGPDRGTNILTSDSRDGEEDDDNAISLSEIEGERPTYR